MHQADNKSIQNLVGEALRESSDLAQKEFALFRTEMTQNVRTMFIGLAMVVVAAVFAIAAVMLLTEALIVGVALAAVAIGLGLYGRNAISSFSLMPPRTVRSVKRDAQVLSERVAE